MAWISALLAAISTLVIGFVWYHPKLFGTAWMKSLGMTEADAAKGNMAVMYGSAVVLAMVMTMPLAYQVGHPDENLSPFMHGFYHGAYYNGVMLAAPVTAINGIFNRMTLTHILISAGYWVVTLGVMGGILAMMHGGGNGAG